MNRIHQIRRLAAALAGVVGTLLAFAAAVPAAFAASHPTPIIPLMDKHPPLPPGWNKHPPLPPRGYYVHYAAHQGPSSFPGRTVVTGGMPGWQIALIAIGAALVAAAAVLAYRAWAARRNPAAAAA